MIFLVHNFCRQHPDMGMVSGKNTNISFILRSSKIRATVEPFYLSIFFSNFHRFWSAFVYTLTLNLSLILDNPYQLTSVEVTLPPTPKGIVDISSNFNFMSVRPWFSVNFSQIIMYDNTREKFLNTMMFWDKKIIDHRSYSGNITT